MHGPPLVGWLLVVTGSATGLSCLLRMRAGCAAAPGERRTARDEGVMGLGMGLMAVPAPVLDQHPWGPPLFVVAFGAMALRFAVLARDERHRFHHAVEAAAMAYTALAMGTGGGSGMAGMAGAPGMGSQAGAPTGIPVLTGVLLCYFAVYALATGIRMLPAAGRAPVTVTGPRAGSLLEAPELAAACRLSLGIGMFTMLLTM
ncbi:DUF5134 domain-containing protein [Streptomyces sp. RB6PN25]|uniref:DUF5134 domain-containing protein n=1 Tax=Streptomyces humicola TaxID=2953240 RepID=A0ABT1Q095_9ACTN|nr:DUF5134 domain-containing protein [Streptomyces humicola]MCQ4083337.1 DUF5134 domain-containing protein [Streptomyces humicola]